LRFSGNFGLVSVVRSSKDNLLYVMKEIHMKSLSAPEVTGAHQEAQSSKRGQKLTRSRFAGPAAGAPDAPVHCRVQGMVSFFVDHRLK
jgi:hypothetical protein